jgi:hypothetical protein
MENIVYVIPLLVVGGLMYALYKLHKYKVSH